jgi:uncharacterized membrane protein
LRPVVEDVAEVAVTVFTVDLHAIHPVRGVGACTDILCDCGIGKRRPARARIEFLFGAKEDVAAGLAAIDPGFVIIYIFAREGGLSPALAHHVMLLWSKLFHVLQDTIALGRGGAYASGMHTFKRLSVVLILLLAFAGLADSAYLAQHESSGTPIICNIDGLSDCNTVLKSSYSSLFGIPLADYGVLFYSVLFALAALELFVFDRLLRRVLQGLSALGLLASIVFVLIQKFAINAFCIYCLTSALVALLIFICATLIEPIRLKKYPTLPPAPPPPPRVPPTLLMPPA